MPKPVDLFSIVERVRNWHESRAVEGERYGTYRFTLNGTANFYASCDVAIIRWMVGEDLQTELSEDQRDQWAHVINSYQSPIDGHFGPEMNHHIAHSNGTGTKALRVLGKQYRYPVSFYSLFNTSELIRPWLSMIQWKNAWGASHLVTGGPVIWQNSVHATQAWKDACIHWFDEQLNEYGSWPKSFVYNMDNPLTPLGCGVHIWPLYRHQGRPVPAIEQMADFVLDKQRPEGYWDTVGGYGSLDGLYVLAVAIELDLPGAGAYRDAMRRYFPLHMQRMNNPWVSLNAHQVLGWVGCIAYLQRGLPDEFQPATNWGDIFDVKDLYSLDVVMKEPPTS